MLPNSAMSVFSVSTSVSVWPSPATLSLKNWSSPRPPVYVSLPLPPFSVSLNGEPISRSSPVPPVIVSATSWTSEPPAPVEELPRALASIVLFPFRPLIVRLSVSAIELCFT